jgi:signal transduction histidine kinase
MQNARGLNEDVNRMSPRLTIAFALVLGFIVFGSTDLLEQWLFAPDIPGDIRILHLIRGFVAAAGGMLCVWAVMSKKEQELTKLRERLADQLADRTNDVQLLTIMNQEGALQVTENVRERERLQKSLLQHRNDFLAVIDHRLRNPLLASKRACGLLLQGDFGPLESSQQEIIQLIAESSWELDRCLTMLMDIYSHRNGTKDLNLAPVAINEILKQISASIVNGKRMSVQMEISEGTVVCADRDEMHTLLFHLIDNAVKYARSAVTVQTRLVPGNMLEIVVQDDGFGMPAADVETIFDRFFVASAKGAYPAVTGIGLCLCSEIARSHGGTVTCKSTLGQGTTMTVQLPLISISADRIGLS